MFDWSDYFAYAEKKVFPKHTVLYRQGEITNGFYYLEEGRVHISVLRDDGYERMIDIVYPGVLLGEQAVNKSTSFTTATVATDATLYFFSTEQFERMTNHHPEIARAFIYSLVKKIRMLVNSYHILHAPVDVQIAHFFLILQERTGNTSIQLTHHSIAKYIGKSRVAVWSVLKDWKKEGIIETNDRTFTIKAPEKLKEKAKIFY